MGTIQTAHHCSCGEHGIDAGHDMLAQAHANIPHLMQEIDDEVCVQCAFHCSAGGMTRSFVQIAGFSFQSIAVAERPKLSSPPKESTMKTAILAAFLK